MPTGWWHLLIIATVEVRTSLGVNLVATPLIAVLTPDPRVIGGVAGRVLSLPLR